MPAIAAAPMRGIPVAIARLLDLLALALLLSVDEALWLLLWASEVADAAAAVLLWSLWSLLLVWSIVLLLWSIVLLWSLLLWSSEL